MRAAGWQHAFLAIEHLENGIGNGVTQLISLGIHQRYHAKARSRMDVQTGGIRWRTAGVEINLPIFSLVTKQGDPIAVKSLGFAPGDLHLINRFFLQKPGSVITDALIEQATG